MDVRADGTQALASPYTGVWAIHGVSATGEVAYTAANGAFLSAAGAANPTAPVPLVSTDVRPIGTDWYGIVGRNVYRLDRNGGAPSDAGPDAGGDAAGADTGSGSSSSSSSGGGTSACSSGGSSGASGASSGASPDAGDGGGSEDGGGSCACVTAPGAVGASVRGLVLFGVVVAAFARRRHARRSRGGR